MDNASDQAAKENLLGDSAMHSIPPGSRVSESNSEYQPPPHIFYRNENQIRLRDFLSRFKEDNFQKMLAKDDSGPGAFGENEDEVIKKDKDKKWDASVLFRSNAPLDATGCSSIQSLKQYINGVHSEIKNPRNAFFELSRHYYNSKYDKDNKKEITVRSYIITEDYQNYVKDLSMDIIQTNQGCMPIVKTFEWNAYNKRKFVKALKFYNYRTDGKLKKQFIVDEGVMHENFRTYDTSILHFGNTIIFYKREENWHKLQQYDVVKDHLVELEGYQIEEPIGQEIRYHVMFSKQFAMSRKEKRAHANMSVYDFLAEQFVICQSYQINDQLDYLNMPIVMFQMGQQQMSMVAPESGPPRILPEAIQYVCHFKDESSPNLHFLAMDPFSTHEFYLDPQAQTYSEYTTYTGNNEMQMLNIKYLKDPDPNEAEEDDDKYTSQWRHDNLSPFLKHQHPQFIIQKEKVVLNIIEKNKTVDQYYYITNDNQFMLIYPNYLNVEQKNQVIFQLAQKHQYNANPDEDYEYLDDFNQRQKDYNDVKYKKISHISNESHRSKNHMKRASHLRMILDYPRDLSVYDKLILSTDQEQSNIYVYQSKVVTGENKIEIYSYQNNIAYSSKPKTLPQLIKETNQDEILAYGPKTSCKKYQADSETYYVNSKFRNVVSSTSHIKTPFQEDEESRNLTFALETENLSRFVIVEDKQGMYHNLRIKQDHCNERVKLQSYYMTKYYYLFFFTLKNEEDKQNRKHSYFVIRKTIQEVEGMGNDNHQSIIQMDQEVTLILPNLFRGTEKEHLAGYTRNMTFEQLIQFQKEEPQEHFIHLTFEKVYDNKAQIEYVPFIYQMKHDVSSNNLLLFDVERMRVAFQTCVNSNLQIRRYTQKSKAGFVNYTLTRTSEVYDQKSSFFTTHDHATPPINQLSKYAVSLQYNVLQPTDIPEDEYQEQIQARGGEESLKRTVELTEYICRFSCCERCSVQLIGRKALILSDSAQFSLRDSFEAPFFIPYFDRSTKQKGLTVMLAEDKVIRDITNQYNQKQVINLIDQEINNVFHHNSEMLQFGHQKFLTSEFNHDEYVLVVSCQLKQRVYMHGNLENNEAYYLLNKVQKKLLSMQLAKFEYFVLNDDFDQLMREEFFQQQEVLEGKTLCELCLNFPKEVGLGLLQNEEVYKRIDGSLIDEVSLGDDEEVAYYNEVGLCEENKVVQVDFNFVTTIRLAIELNQNQSVKLLLRKVFDLNRKSYQEYLMLDFPKILHAPLVERIYPFLERDHDEYVQTQKDAEDVNLKLKHEFCNFEEFMTHPDLPPFATKQVQYHVKEHFQDFHNCEQELIDEIIQKDPYNSLNVKDYKQIHRAGSSRSIEVEHSAVDFQKVIIGEKVRGYQEGIFHNIIFNDQALASIILVEPEEHIEYYNLETIRKLIDFQFRKTSKFLDLMLKIYALGFLLPFLLSLSTTNAFFLNICYTSCLLTQVFFIGFEVMQLKEQGLDYFSDFWNLIDTSQFIVFMILYSIKMYNQFSTDTFAEMILQAIMLYQSFYKVFYFIRIYDSMCFIITLAIKCGLEVFPFALFTISIMLGFSKIFQVLHGTVSNPELDFIGSEYIRLLIATYQNTYGGEKQIMKIEDGYYKSLEGNEFQGTVVWVLVLIFQLCQAAFFGIMGTFFVAQLFQAYEKHYSKMPMYQYKVKAQFNVDCNQIMDLFMKSSVYKVVFFSIDRKRKRIEDERWLGMSNAIRILTTNQNNENNDKRKEDMKKTEELSTKQSQANDQLKDLLQEQARLGQSCSQIMQHMQHQQHQQNEDQGQF